MAFLSLFSSPLTPALDKNMTDRELTDEAREDGELEDGEIEDGGINIEGKEEAAALEKDQEKEKDNGSHGHARRRRKKKRKSRKRKRDQKHPSASNGSSSDSYDSDQDHQDRPRSKKSKASYRDHDGEFELRENETGKVPRSAQHKSSDMDKYSDYSEDAYDYDEDEEDFSEELSKYKHAKESSSHGKSRPKDQAKKPGMMGQHKQPLHGGGQRGKGRGAVGRGRGMLSKNKKQKGKAWGRGRGRGGDHGGDADPKAHPPFQKKRPIMSAEFISQHTVEHNGRHICKYFIEGRCIKGNQCKFEHDNVKPEKKKELCKFYVQGYCTKGESCIYMHNEYPCKFFHTGAKCYQGDNCKFSHDPLTDVTKELLDKILNVEEEHVDEDELELENLRKQGIAPLPKPPPGVGLLPTPGPGSSPDSGRKIPSLFEIKVQPTVDLVQKIALRPSFYNSTSPTEEISSPPHPSLPPAGPLGSPPLPYTGPSMSQSPPGQPPPQGFGQRPPMPPPGQPPFHGMSSPPINQKGAPFPPVSDVQTNMPFQHMPSEFFKSLFSSQSFVHQDDEESDSRAHENSEASGMQDLLPAVQKVLLLHLNQSKQESDPHKEPRGAAPPSRERDESHNWYSSDEEEGSSVAAILNSLKKQNNRLKNQPGMTPLASNDPRLQKDRTLPGDPRVKPDLRQRPSDPRRDSGDAARDPRKMKPLESSPSTHPANPSMSHKPSNGEDEDESERELRERAASIPLEPSPGALLRDPRCQIKPFSHIRVDILLQRPAFAQTVVWSAEDLIPLLIPKQEHSINLPLPPLIADAQLNRNFCSPPEQQPSATPCPPDPRLAAARFKEGIGRLGSPPGRTSDPRHHIDRPMDPRAHKDPRISRSGSLDSKLPVVKETPAGGGSGDPRLQRSASSNQPSAVTRSESEKLPPYAPRLASSMGAGLESPTTLLGGISLYDPRNRTLLSPKRDPEEPHKKSLRASPKLPPHPTLQTSPARGADKEQDEDLPSSPPVTLMMPPSPCSPVRAAAPAMHNLPIQALAGLIRPAYSDPRQNKPVGPASVTPQEDEEDKDKKARPLRDVFKAFDPTASPFFQ